MLSTGKNCTDKMWPHSSSLCKVFSKSYFKKIFCKIQNTPKSIFKIQNKKILFSCSVLFRSSRILLVAHVDAILSCQPLVPGDVHVFQAAFRDFRLVYP